MYLIAWRESGERKWEIVDGEQEMQVFVSDISERVEAEDGLYVFSMDNELDVEYEPTQS